MSKWFKKDVHLSDSEEEDSEEDVYSEDESYDEESDEEESTPRKAATGTSKWFKATADSDEDEEEDEDEYDDEEEDRAERTGPVPVTRKPEDRMRRYFEEEDEEDEKRVVRSQKARRLDELRDQIEKLDDVRKNNRWRDAQEAFLELNKSLDKVLKVHEQVPNMYIRCIVALEQAAAKAAKDRTTKARMTASDSRALGPILSRIRKNNAQYKNLISDYAKNPELFEDEDEEDEEVEEERPQRVAPSKPALATAAGAATERASRWFKKDADSSDEDDDDLDDSDDMDDFDDSDDDFDTDEDESDDDKIVSKPDAKRNFWLKSSETEVKQQRGRKTRKGVGKATTQRRVRAERQLPQPKKKMLEEMDWTADLIEENIIKIRQNKGKRGVDPQEQYDLLKILFQNSEIPSKQIEILLLMISISFDIGTSHFMPAEIWNNSYLNMLRILHIIDQLPDDVNIIEQEETLPLLAAATAAEAEPMKKDDVNTLRITGNIVTIFERLDEEFIKSLQYTDPHMQKYVQRLNDECMLMDMSERLFILYSSKGDMEKAARIAVRIFGHIYYKKQEEHEKILRKQREQITQILKEGSFSFKNHQTVITEDLESVLKELSALIYKHNKSEVEKTRIMLLLIYHSAIFDKFYEARDMLMMSRIQDTIYRADISLQILYNRAIAQLGLCAFRNGMIHDTHACLQELCSSPKTRELLAQNLINIRQLAQMTVAQRQEHERLIPYHMHINLTKLEAVHLICAMLLEIPSMSQTGQTTSRQVGGLRKRKVISKPLRKLLDMFDRQLFIGPPDNTKEHIYVAAKALLRGDWSECYNLLMKLSIWNLVVDSENAKDMLRNKIKIEALRTYLFQFSKHYETIGLEFLVSAFELPANQIHSIVSKMIINDELFAAWDQPTQSIIIDRSAELSRLQQLALQLAERTNNFVELNERTFDAKAGTVEYVTAQASIDRRRTGAAPDRRHPAAASRRQPHQQQPHHAKGRQTQQAQQRHSGQSRKPQQKHPQQHSK